MHVFEDTKLGRKYPGIARIWHAHSEQVTPCLSFTEPVRKAIYATNAIESLNSCVRRAVLTRGHVPSHKAATKRIYMAIGNVERDWKRPSPFWHQAHRRLRILHPDRFHVVPR